MSQFCVKTIPVLRMFDVAKAKEFYVDWLGFTIDWEHRFADGMPLYMQIFRQELTLHLSEHHGDCSPGGKVFVITEQVEDIYQALMAKNYPYNRPRLETAPWNARCFEVTDPFGNRILFNQYLGQS